MNIIYRGHIFSHVRPFCERAVSDLGPQRSLNRPVQVAHSSFTEGSHTAKNTASGSCISNRLPVMSHVLVTANGVTSCIKDQQCSLDQTATDVRAVEKLRQQIINTFLVTSQLLDMTGSLIIKQHHQTKFSLQNIIQ